MADTIRRECPKCHGHFFLNGGTARCPHCGQVVSATGVATRNLGRPINPRLQPNSGARETREAIRQTLAANKNYWVAEAQTIMAEFGALPTWLERMLG